MSVVQRQGADPGMVTVAQGQGGTSTCVQAPYARRCVDGCIGPGDRGAPGDQPAIGQQKPLVSKLQLRAQVNVQNFENVLVRFEWHP
jgi:hypothetical protein